MRDHEIELLNMLPLEERAKESEKTLPCGLSALVFVIGLSLGLYYWFFDEIGFSYYDISPFWGFAIYTLSSVCLLFAIAWLYSSYWSEYNKSISAACDQIEEIIKSGSCDPVTLKRLKTDSIERKIAKKCLTQEEFDWHSSIYCWGCGKEHTRKTIPYKVYRERTESWKEGAYRYSKTFQKTAYIDLCPDCYNRLTKSDRISFSNGALTDKIFWTLVFILSIGYPILAIIGFFEDTGDSLLESIGYGLLGGFLIFGLASSLGRIVLFPIAMLIALPFAKKGADSKTKWSFDDIPSIREFYNRKLPHTH